MALRSLHLFAGIGGGILADLLSGIQPVGAVEINGFCRDILLRRQSDGSIPRFPIWDDVTTFRSDNPATGNFIDRCRQIRDNLVISGGFPCQDISCANFKPKGISGSRSGLWKEFARIIGEIEPQFCFIENSPMLLSRGVETVLSDLSAMGYYVSWGIVSAQSVGAPHLRRRFWAFATKERQIPNSLSVWSGRNGSLEEDTSHDRIVGRGTPEPHIRRRGDAQSAVRRMANGISDWLDGIVNATLWDHEESISKLKPVCPKRNDRLNALGNAQVPLQAAAAFESLVTVTDLFFRTMVQEERTKEQEKIAELCDILKETLIKKNLDYGSSAFKKPILAPEMETDASILVRMSDKIERIANLRKGDSKTNYESVRDTVMDLAGYCILYLVARGD